ncbi:MAG: CRTAC1 family protein, partial [Acidobacteriota bacterium]
AEPYNVTAAYGLAIAITRSGSAEEGRAAMQRFEALRSTNYARTYSQTYMEQGAYAEAMASTGAEADLVDAAPPAVVFADATSAMLPAAAAPPARQPDAAPAGSVMLVDVDGDGDLDLLEAGQGGLRLYRNTRGVLTDATAAAGLSGPAAAAVAADYDNDGRPDVLVLGVTGTRLLHQRADGRFEEAQGLPAYPHRSRSAAFLDADHDGDLDILIAGDRAPNQLLRNNGDGTFTDISAAAGVVAADAAGIAVVPTDFDNRRDLDMLVVRRGAAPLLLQNVRDGSFRDAAAASGLPREADYPAVAAGDYNKDGYPDFFFARAGAPGVFATSDGKGRFVTSAGPAASAGAIAAQFVDYDNDGLLDLFIVGDRQARLFRNLGSQWIDMSQRAGLAGDALQAAATDPFQSAASADLDGDGDTDIVLRLASGALRVWRNDGGSRGHSLRVRLDGRVSNRGGVGSKIDLRAGSLRQRIETSAAIPMAAPADLLFGLGARPTADVVRVLWPSGTVQAETAPVASTTGGGAPVVTIEELNRKPSSCPFLFTWNGTRFEFLTDFMGGGELGYWLAPDQRAAPDPDEYVRIPSDRLKVRDGRYDLRITNELEETLFLDRVQLVAVDHAEGVEVYPNEGLKEAPLPPFVLTTTRGARPLAAAVDDAGQDMLSRLAAVDRRYADSFRLIEPRGYAAAHTLALDLGEDAARAVLVMTGWTDYAFSSDNVAASQRGLTLHPPSLEVQDASGAWRTVVKDIGIPVGRPQTVVVDLRGKLGGSRRVRIVTDMRIYWDQILVDTSGGGAPTRVSRLDPAAADLRSRGFSAEVMPDGREPIVYDYSRVTQEAMWKVMPGRYTREGDVRPLVRASDDMFVVARPGDEVALSFAGSALPPLPAGWTRTFLLYADGFSKEMDINSASPHEAGPLPFHRMTRYPYDGREHYPRSQAHLDYLARYNTRVVHNEMPPLD